MIECVGLDIKLVKIYEFLKCIESNSRGGWIIWFERVNCG